MPVRPRGNKWQVDVAFKGLRRQEQCETELAAKYREAEILQELQEESSGKASKKWTLETAVERTREVAWKGSKSEASSMKNATLMLRYFGRKTLIKDIDTDWVDRWISHMESKNNSGATINRKIACLSKCMSIALERGALDKKPHMERQRESQGRIRYLTHEEESTIIDLLERWSKYDHRDVVVFSIDTGFRPGETYKLSKRDINFETGLITVWESKNGVVRSIPMTNRVREILKRRSETSSKIFPYSDGWLRNQWDKMAQVLRLDKDPDFVPYCLRHTCASRLAQKGVHLLTIQKWMGHTDIKTTMRYAHFAPASLQSGLEALEKPISISAS